MQRTRDTRKGCTVCSSELRPLTTITINLQGSFYVVVIRNNSKVYFSSKLKTAEITDHRGQKPRVRLRITSRSSFLCAFPLPSSRGWFRHLWPFMPPIILSCFHDSSSSRVFNLDCVDYLLFFFLFLWECVAAPSVRRTLFLSALREHMNVACFSTTLFNPLPPPWTVQRADRWHFIFVFWIRFTTPESIRFLCSFSLTRARTQKTGKKMSRPKPKTQVKSRLKPIYFSDDRFLYTLFMLSAAINIGLVCIDFYLFSQAFTPPSLSH